MRALWLRLPLQLRAVLTGLAAAMAGTVPWAILVSANTGGNVFSAAGLFLGERSEWQLSSAPKPLIWESGPDASFWVTLVALLVVAAAAVWAYSGLSHAARSVRRSASGGE